MYSDQVHRYAFVALTLAACTPSDQRWSCDVPATAYCREYINVDGRSAVVNTSAAQGTCNSMAGTWRPGEECSQTAVGRCISDSGYISIDYYYNGYNGADYDADPTAINTLEVACTNGAHGSFQVPPFSDLW